MNHLTRHELTRFWRGDSVERERILAHLAECDECGALYGEVVDVEPPAPAAVPRGLLARGRRAYRRPGGARARTVRWRVALPAAALAAAGVAVTLRFWPAPPVGEIAAPATASALRGAGVQALEPAGAVAPPVVFRWASAVRPSRFALEVRDERGATVLRLDTSDESLALGSGDLARLTLGARYEWRVVALDAEGAALTESRWLPFVVSSGP